MTNRRTASGAGRLGLVDRYLLGQLVAPMSAALAVILVALLLYRVLDIFNYMAGSSARFGLIPRMIIDVAPQYLGLAAPGAYFISMFLVVARLSDTSEVDALFAGGVSISRLSRPLIGLGFGVAILNILLLGFAQPYGHYGFNADLDAALHAPWDARVQPRTFVAAAGVVLSAEHADPSGRRLQQVFVRRAAADGSEQVITAASATVTPSADGLQLTVALVDGQQFIERADAAPVLSRFSRLVLEARLAGPPPGFRGRGPGPRELTLSELFRQLGGDPSVDRAKAASEFNARIVRTLSVPLLPLLAVPAGMAAKRRRRGLGTALCAIVLFLYENIIDFGQSLADAGRLPVAVAIWAPFALFAAASTWLFLQSRMRPGETPLAAASDALESWLGALVSRLRRAARREAATVGRTPQAATRR